MGKLPHSPEHGHNKIDGFALSAFQHHQSQVKSDFPTDEQIDGDLKLLGKYASRVRTCSMLQKPRLPRLAE
jgi:hypothetical protein